MDWETFSGIFYLPGQEDDLNPYLATAAGELKTYLEQMTGRQWPIINTSRPPECVSLLVDPTDSVFADKGDEVFHLVIDANGVSITGKTALACRHGAYHLLDQKLGVRWYWPNPAWTVVPPTLTAPTYCDEVHKPATFWRDIWLNDATWVHRNRLLGAKAYWFSQNYSAIIPRTQANFIAHPEWFLPEGVAFEQNWPWQLRPDNPDVLQATIVYVMGIMNQVVNYRGDNLRRNGVSVAPNDANGWDPPWSVGTTEGQQAITDAVLGLANNVALAIKNTYPGAFIGCYQGGAYCRLPTFPLDPALIIQVSTLFNYGNLSDAERFNGIKAAGATLGLYDALDEWGWWHDSPGLRLNSMKNITNYDIKCYTGEASGQGWGARGLSFFIASRLLWDPTLNIDDILNDFYNKAFGTAQEPIREYFESQKYEDEDNYLTQVGVNFLKLQEAEGLTSDPAILERIRHLEYYQRYLWLYFNRGVQNLSLAELQDFYKFVTKIKNISVLNYPYIENNLRTSLINRGMTAAQVNSLQDFTPPTPAEATTYLDEALGASGADINPYYGSLIPLGDETHPDLATPPGGYQIILVPSDGNEAIEINFKGYMGYVEWYGGVSWDNENGNLLATSPVSTTNNWVTLTFSAPTPGLYIAKAIYGQGYPSITVVDHPASQLFVSYNSPRIMGPSELYFYVSAGSGSFVLGFPAYQNYPINSVTIYDPSGNVAGSFANFPSAGEGNITREWTSDASPQAGVWKVSFNPSQFANFWISGILPLAWTDTKNLLIKAPQQEQTHQVSINIVGQGSTNPSLGTYTVTHGQTIEVSATPDIGWIFSSWEGDFSGGDAQISLPVNSDISLTAVFTKQVVSYELTLTAGVGGTTSPAPGTYSAVEGGSIQVAAIAASGYAFSYWEEGGVSIGTDQQINLFMYADRSVEAVFEQITIPPDQYAVTISVVGSGTTDPPIGPYTFDAGLPLTVKATPASGWKFSHWEGDVTGTQPTANFTVDTNMSIVAVFSEIPPSPPVSSSRGIVIAGVALAAIIIPAILFRRKK